MALKKPKDRKHKKPRNFKSDMDFSEFKAAAKEKGVTIKVWSY